jgi:hypothetical protein
VKDDLRAARVEQKYMMKFAVGGECMRKFEEARALLSGRFPKGAPIGRGGTNAVDNLRLLCARHNRLEAERVYGGERLRRFC